MRSTAMMLVLLAGLVFGTNTSFWAQAGPQGSFVGHYTTAQGQVPCLVVLNGHGGGQYYLHRLNGPVKPLGTLRLCPGKQPKGNPPALGEAMVTGEWIFRDGTRGEFTFGFDPGGTRFVGIWVAPAPHSPLAFLFGFSPLWRSLRKNRTTCQNSFPNPEALVILTLFRFAWAGCFYGVVD